MSRVVDVTCPPGVSEGDVIAVTVGASTFEVALPPNTFEGDVFNVELPADVADDAPELPVLGVLVDALEARGAAADGNDVAAEALHRVLDALEDHDNPALDELVDGHCSEFANYDGEALLEWTQLHAEFMELADEHIGQVLASLDTTAEEVFAYCQAYSGSDKKVHKLIKTLLAMGEFSAFCEMSMAPESRPLYLHLGRRKCYWCCCGSCCGGCCGGCSGCCCGGCGGCDGCSG